MTNQEKRDMNRHDALYSGKDAPLTLGVRCGMPRKSSLLHRSFIRITNRHKRYKRYKAILEAEEQRLLRSDSRAKARAKEISAGIAKGNPSILKMLYNRFFGGA